MFKFVNGGFKKNVNKFGLTGVNVGRNIQKLSKEDGPMSWGGKHSKGE